MVSATCHLIQMQYRESTRNVFVFLRQLCLSPTQDALTESQIRSSAGCSATMSSRGPVGASNRAELFSSRDAPPVSPSRATPRESARMGEFVGGGTAGDFSPDARAREMKQTYGLSNVGIDDGGDYDDPLQLEHILGYSGDYRKTILCVPGDENLFVKR